ncbi:MAG TPA: maleylpyruvate isomerase N-terminal domain-containing protein, partial [Marmoricola sp.]|nr:maleylpyruvate isomerase N-terminal domain-containing protein [Marmoricola sp.]
MTMTPQAGLLHLIETWRQATADLVALARTIEINQWESPTALDGWDVKDVVAHCAHLEAILAGAPEETIEIGSPPHVKNLMGAYTEQG